MSLDAREKLAVRHVYTSPALRRPCSLENSLCFYVLESNAGAI